MTPEQAIEATDKVWTERRHNRGPIPLRWETLTGGDGNPFVSARIDSPHAAIALLAFAREGSLSLDWSGPAQQPFLDETVPGVTGLVWRTGGVWVQLWHHAVQTPAMPVVETVTDADAVKDRPAGRLPFRRFRRTNLGRAS